MAAVVGRPCEPVPECARFLLTADGGRFVELGDYVAALRRRWPWLAAAVAGALSAAVLLTLSATPLYRAGTQTFVSVQTGATTSELAQGASFSQQQVSSYTQLVTSPLVLGPVIDELGLATRADALAARIATSSPTKTSLIDITVTDESPVMAAAIADAVTAQFAEVVDELEQPVDGGATPVRMTTVRSAAVPTAPSSPDAMLNVSLALLLGLVLGIGLALLRELLDTKVKNESDVSKISTASIVGAIANDDDAQTRPLIVQTDPHSPRAEAFRRLRTNVQFLDIADQPHSIIVTSSLPAEGKSTTTINLAIALADSGTRVVLVDADLRRPSVARYMGLEGAVGLTTVLIGKASLADMVQPWGNGNLHVLPSGQIPPNPSELLGSAAMAAVLKELTQQYDLVLVDTPPLLPVTDAAILSKLTGGALVVIGAGTVHRQQVQESLGALETVGARVLGLVLNREARKNGKSYEYYRYETPAASTPAWKRFGTRRRQSPVAQGTMPPATQPDTPAPALATEQGPTTGALQHVWPGESFTEARLRERSEALPPQHRR